MLNKLIQEARPPYKKRTFEGMIAAIRSNIIENRRSEDLVGDKIKSKVNQHWDLIIAAVRMQRRWFFDSANMRCVPHLKKYI